MQLQWAGDAGSIHINDREYHLRRAHWHSPSEHSINGRRNITCMTGQKYEERISGVMDPKDVKMGSKRHYRYMGSLIVPPCTEGVIWTINKKVRTVSKDQYAQRNARTLQPDNRREVHLYAPEDMID
ncbi:hypothetical protein RJ639_002608 [Escallonia herrerae]|uniref:Alpha-carbonic anhydrase domain-containing protein n=1 Tax=Escallonia herrerae TaxID=1293975 RepID=A0AA88XR39_9ASTE|nr:hypothetical protein RJ639_002608 [Escallonia herrerae]